MSVKIRWRVKAFLAEHGISPYRLREESGLRNETIYAQLLSDETQGLKFKTLEAVIETMEKLLGREVRLEELIEIVRD